MHTPAAYHARGTQEAADELDLNIRDDADSENVRPRGGDEASDDDEYEYAHLGLAWLGRVLRLGNEAAALFNRRPWKRPAMHEALMTQLPAPGAFTVYLALPV